MKMIVSLALAAAATVAAVPAAAGSAASASNVEMNDDGSYRIQVSYSDLDLATPAGLQALQGRMKLVANMVCSTNQAPNLEALAAESSCRKDINEAARPQIALAQRGAGAGVVISEGR